MQSSVVLAIILSPLICLSGQLGFMTKNGVTKPSSEIQIELISTAIRTDSDGGKHIDIIITDKNNRNCIVKSEVLPNVDLVSLAFNLQNLNSSIVCKIDNEYLPDSNSHNSATHVWITTRNFK